MCYSVLLQIIVLGLIPLLSFAPAALSQSFPVQINFQQVLEGKDIALGEVEAVYQDSEGFMWFGGRNGLFRFDGYNFKELKYLDDRPGSEKVKLSVKAVTSIYEDKFGDIWVATRSGTLKYTVDNDKFGRALGSTGEESLLSNNFEQLAESPTGELLAASYVGLVVVDVETHEVRLVLPADENGNTLENVGVSRVYVDENIVWLGTNLGLVKLDWSTKKMHLISLSHKGENATDENKVSGVAPGNRGQLWVGTRDGLVDLNTQTYDLTRYKNNPDDQSSLSNNVIWDLFKDSQGLLWVATDQGGLNLYNPSSKGFVRFQHKIGSRGSISSNVIRTVFEDRTGDLWIGTYPEGLNFFDRSSTAITTYSASATDKNSLSHNSILTVQEDEKGNLWFGSDGGGLNYFDRSAQKFTHYKHSPQDESSISSNAILSSWLSDEGNIWVGTWGGGISVLDNATGKFKRIPFLASGVSLNAISTSDKLSNANVWCIYRDSQNFIWVCTHEGGLNKYNAKDKSFTHYMANLEDPTTISSNMVWNVFEDSHGVFWVATASGLNILDRETGQFKVFLEEKGNLGAIKSQNVLAFYEDSKRRLWMASSGGLQQYNHENGMFTIFGKADGFLDESMRSILEDEDGNLWVGTDNGITRFNPDSKQVKNYNRANGRLMGGLNSKSALLSRQGELIFGGINGVRLINADMLKPNKIKPQIAFTDFKIFAESISVGGPENFLPRSLNRLESITLDYTKSMFEFSFAALNFRDAEKNQYAYMLEGFDKNWLAVGEQRTAKYTNLDAGTYKFRVKGSNNDGVWNEVGRSIIIIQTPAPWKTWWAYTIYSFLFFAAILSFVYWQHRKRQFVEEQNRILEIKVNERTFELKKKNDDIERMLSNIHQGLFTVSEDGNIDAEYSDYLEDIFETKEIAGSVAVDFIFNGVDLGRDRQYQIFEAFDSMLGEHQMNYDFNSHLLPEELTVSINDKQKILRYEWDPIIDDGFIDRMMVTVRDITLIKRMEREAASKERELSIISQLLNLSTKKYRAFMEAAEQMILANQELLESDSVCTPDNVNLLFRNMHTIKGNSRTHKFTHVSEVAHDIETVFAELRDSNSSGWDKEHLLAMHVELKNVIADYVNVYENVLGRGGSTTAANERDDGCWVSNTIIDRMIQQVKSKNIFPVQYTLESLQAMTLHEVLADLIESLPTIAAELGKAAPVVNIEGEALLLQKSGQSLINNVFTHILRNCIDHGIESIADRQGCGKAEKGTITINTFEQSNAMQIVVGDDGRGLNIARLFSMGVEKGLWKATQTIPPEQVAALIFDSGVSTKEEVTDISGRGVGMDAVKQFLLSQEGDINLRLCKETLNDTGYLPFEFVISIPKAHFLINEKSDGEYQNYVS